MKVLLAHPGTQHSHRLAKQLARLECLYEFWTGFALAEDACSTQALLAFLPKSWHNKIANRIIQGVPARNLRSLPTLEWKALKQIERGLPLQQIFYERNYIFQKRISQNSIRQASAAIGFDTSSWILAEQATTNGKAFFLDQTAVHPSIKASISQKVASRFPDWQENLDSQRSPFLLECENKEYKLATKIIAASSYTKQTLIKKNVSPEKILVNPYGVDLQKFHPATKIRASQPFRFLFLGPIMALKGVPLLLEAWRALALKECELWLVGSIRLQEQFLIPELPGLKFLGKYPHKDLPDLLRQCDALILPSYCDGFAQVLLEALASGLPIITTETTAGPDIIKNGVEGFLIASGDLEALCEVMKYCAANPDRLKSMSLDARRCAERFSWDSYGDRWLQILQEFA